jgi:hypothetical protein
MPTPPSRHSFALILAAALAVMAAAASIARGSVAAPAPGDRPAEQAGHDMSSMPGMAGNGEAPAAPAAPGTPDMQGMHGAGATMPGMPGMGGAGAGAADGAMAHEHMDMGPHMKMTAPRPRAAGDQRRADAIAETLRGAIARYRDYRVAVADGFIQYLPNVPQHIYHFTNYGYAHQAELAFDPARPTSLLYKPVAGGGFELVGAMYTAPRRFDEDQLDERVPLSVAAWHEHVNICLPPKSAYATSDWRRFGFRGTIATASECQSSGGIFHPVIFNWMVHVYPFEQDPAKVWAH